MSDLILIVNAKENKN